MSAFFEKTKASREIDKGIANYKEKQKSPDFKGIPIDFKIRY